MSPANKLYIAILQRVLSASVTVEKELVSSIGRGVLVFAAVAPGDTEKEAESLASKVLKMKLWDDETGGRVILELPLIPLTSSQSLIKYTLVVEEERPRY
jgi:D-Tyr-tRNAtyr deacylase